MLLRKQATSVLVLVLFSLPASAEQRDTIHREMLDGLEQLFADHFVTGAAEDAPLPESVAGVDDVTYPSMIVVGFTGGVERKDSKASGLAGMIRGLEAHANGREEVLASTFNNLRWRRAATQTLEVVRAGRQEDAWLPGMHQPLIIVLGHSWGAGSIAKFARKLKKEDVEISLAIYIDAFSFVNVFLFWRNPRVPDNVQYAVNFYQREGILKGLPMRGKSKLIPEDPYATRILGNYEVQPQTEFWGWSWNILQPLLYRHHHRIAHDPRLQNYLLAVVNLKIELLNQPAETTRLAESPTH